MKFGKIIACEKKYINIICPDLITLIAGTLNKTLKEKK